MWVFLGRLTLCVGIHRRTSFINLSLLLHQCPAYQARLTWMVCEIGGKWPYSFCSVECCFQDFFKTVHNICSSHQTFIKVQVVQPYSSTDKAQLRRIPILFLSDFYMVVNRLIAIHALPICKLISLSVDEILLPRYVNWSANFRGLPFNKKIASTWLKHMNSVLSLFT